MFGSRPLGVAGVGLLLAAGAARVWAGLVQGPISVVHAADPAPAVEGDRVRLRIDVQRASRMPVGSLVARGSLDRLGAYECRLTGRGRSAAAGLDLGRLPRGRFAISDARIELGDHLGLESVSLAVDPAGAAVVVHPRLVELQMLFSDAGRLGGTGRRLLLRRPAGFDFHSVREYTQGESLRRVHWPTTARRGQLMVKELEDTPRDTVVVLLDCDPAGTCGEPGDSSFDEAVRAAGSVLKVYAGRGRKAALATTGVGSTVVRVSSLAEGFQTMLGVLAAAEPDARTKLARWLVHEQTRTADAGSLSSSPRISSPQRSTPCSLWLHGASSPSSGSMRRAMPADRRALLRARSGSHVSAFPSPSFVVATTWPGLSMHLGWRRSRVHRGRTLVACALPALAVSVSWLRLESPPQIAEALVVVALALAPTLVPSGWLRASAVAAAALGAAWIAFGAEPWELLPYRDERVLEPIASAVGQGIGDFYRVLLPLSPDANPEMHGLVLMAIFGFVVAISLLAAASHPLGAAAVTVAGAGWAATLVDGETVALGALALAAALSTPLILRVRSAPALVAGLAAGAVVVAGAMWASSATTVAREAALNWESWDFQKVSAQATGVRFAWDSNYDGIRFPPTKTVVLTVDGPEQARYWRTSTLDLFASDHWFEDLLWLGRIQGDSDAMPLDRLTPARAANRDNWLEQRIEVKALVDDRLAAAGTPVALDARRLGHVFRMSGGVLRVRSPLGEGQRYRVWSYAPDPAPAVLAASKPRYPTAARRYLELDSRNLPVWRSPGRNRIVRELLDAPANDSFAAYAALYEIAGRVTGSSASPYAAVLALESWFRHRGGLRLRRAATHRGRPAARVVRDADQGGLLPALRGCDGGDAAPARDPRPGRGGIHERDAQGRQVGRHRPRGTRLGRGLVRRAGMGAVRPDSGPRDVRRHVLVRLGLEGRSGCASAGGSERSDPVRRPRAAGPRRPGSCRRGRRRARAVDLRVRSRIGRPLGARGRARQGDLPPRPLPDP